MSPIEQPPQNDEEPTAGEGHVVDPAVLADRRARRGTPEEGSLLERLNRAEQDRVLLATRLADVERSLGRAEHERHTLAAELDRRERDLRSAHQREFAEQRRRVEAEDDLVRARREANDELDSLRRELCDAEERIAELGRELARARRDAAALRPRVAEEGERAEALASAQASLAELAEASAQLRSSFERELAATEERLRAEADEERARLVAELVAVETRVSGLRTQLGAAVGESPSRPVAESVERNPDAERIETQERLDRALQAAIVRLTEVRGTEARRESAAPAAGARAGIVEATHAAEHAQGVAGPSDLGVRVPGDTRSQQDPALGRPGQDDADVAAEEQPGTSAPSARTGGEPDAHTTSLIEDLQRAADRLRAQFAEAGAQPDVDVAADLAGRRAAEGEGTPAPGIDLEILESRGTAGPTHSPWLAGVVAAVAADDITRVAAVIEALLPGLAARARHGLVFDLGCEGVGEWRVELAVGRADVVRRPAGPVADVDFAVAGPLGSVLPLVCGGAPRRLDGATVHGRKRRLRRLLKDLRQPLGFAEIALSGVPVDAGTLLDLLVRGLPADALAGASMVVDYDVAGAAGGRWRVAVCDGRATVASGSVAGMATATVHVSDVGVAALLAGAASPPGERVVLHGSRAAVDRLHRAFDVVQGQA